MCGADAYSCVLQFCLQWYSTIFIRNVFTKMIWTRTDWTLLFDFDGVGGLADVDVMIVALSVVVLKCDDGESGFYAQIWLPALLQEPSSSQTEVQAAKEVRKGREKNLVSRPAVLAAIADGFHGLCA